MSGPVRLFEQVNRYFDKAAAFTSHPRGLLNQIKTCNSIIRISFPLKRDDGTIEVELSVPDFSAAAAGFAGHSPAELLVEAERRPVLFYPLTTIGMLAAIAVFGTSTSLVGHLAGVSWRSVAGGSRRPG